MSTIQTCDCANGPFGVPDMWKVVIAGTTNGTCSTCSSANGTYTLQAATPCFWHTTMAFCTQSWALELRLTSNSDGTCNLEVKIAGPPDQATWTVSNLVGPLDGKVTLNVVTSTNKCGYPSTVTATPVPASLSNLKSLVTTDLACYTALAQGIVYILPMPNLGGSDRPCQMPSSCGCGPGGGNGGAGGAGGAWGRPFKERGLSFGRPQTKPYADSGATPDSCSSGSCAPDAMTSFADALVSG